MDSIATLITALNSMSPLAVIGLLAVVLYYQAKNNKHVENTGQAITGMKTNDLHELPNMAADLRTMVDTLQRIEVKMGEEFGYIRARLNGRA